MKNSFIKPSRSSCAPARIPPGEASWLPNCLKGGISKKKGMPSRLPAGMPFGSATIRIYRFAWIASSLAFASGMYLSRLLIFSQS